MSPSTFLETFAADLRFGARSLLRNPAFATIAVLTLALGIGANAAIFSVVNTVLLRPLPWADPGRAVMIWSKWTAFDKTWVSAGEVLDYRRRTQTMSEVGAWSDGQINITGDGEPERVPAAQVTANLFSVLGVSPLSGRTFTAAEDVPNGPDLVILGHGLWTRRYAADPSIVGRSIQIERPPVPGHRHHAARFRPADGLRESGADTALDAAADRSRHNRSRQPRLLRRRTAEARGHGQGGGRRASRDRAGHDARGFLSRADAVRHGGAVAHGRSRRTRAPRHPAAARRRRVPAAHRVRQRRQPPACTGGSQAARNRGPFRTGRRRLAARPATVDRELRPDERRRGDRVAARVCGRPVRRMVESREHPAGRVGHTRCPRPRLHGPRRAPDQHRLQSRARVARTPRGPHRRSQGRADAHPAAAPASASGTHWWSSKWRWRSFCSWARG